MKQIKELEKQYTKARDTYLDAIFDAIVDEETFWEYYPRVNDILGTGAWLDDCPEFIDTLFSSDYYLEKGSTVFYSDILAELEYYRDGQEGATDIEVEILNKYTTWELMQQIVNYTKENKICGTVYDW